MLDTQYVRDFGAKARFLGRLPNYPAAKVAMSKVKFCATDKELQTFFGIKAPRWANWRKNGQIHREFEIALAMRYGFSPSSEYFEERGTTPLRDIYTMWFKEEWTSWRTGNLEDFKAEMFARLAVGDVWPRSADDPDLLKAIADIPKSEEARRTETARRVGPATPPSLAGHSINTLLELVSMSVCYPGGNNPEDGRVLLVSLNANVDRMKDGDRTYLYQLNGARLDLRAKAMMPHPIGWTESGPQPQVVGRPGWTLRLLTAPPADVVWRVDRTEPGFGGSGFSYEDFGTLIGGPDPVDALLLKVREADLDVDVEDSEQRQAIIRMSNNKRKVWKNVIVRAALEAEEGSGPYRTLCSQQLEPLA